MSRLAEVVLAVPAPGPDRVRRPGRAHRDDGGRGRAPARLAGPRRSSSTWSAATNLDPRTELDRARDPHRLPPRRLARASSSRALRSSCRRSLIVWALAWAYVRFGRCPPRAASALRRQAGDARDRGAGAVGLRAHRACNARAASPGGIALVRGRAAAACTSCWCCSVGRASPRCAGRTPTRARAARGRCAAARRLRRAPRVRARSAALFWIFLKIGSVLFGSGYVLLAFLRADLVERLALADRGAAARRGRRRPGDAGAGVHDRDVRRLPARAGRGRAGRDGRHLPAGVRVRRAQRAARAAAAPLARPRARSSTACNVASLALMAVVTVQLGARRGARRADGAHARPLSAPPAGTLPRPRRAG